MSSQEPRRKLEGAGSDERLKKIKGRFRGAHNSAMRHKYWRLAYQAAIATCVIVVVGCVIWALAPLNVREEIVSALVR